MGYSYTTRCTVQTTNILTFILGLALCVVAFIPETKYPSPFRLPFLPQKVPFPSSESPPSPNSFLPSLLLRFLFCQVLCAKE